MKISTKERLATGTALVAIGLIAVAIGLTYGETEDASTQRRQASEIGRGLAELRLVTFEYRQTRIERARVQWHAVADRLDRLLAADNRFSATEQRRIVGNIRERMALVRTYFTALSPVSARDAAGGASAESQQLLESQLNNRLLIVQQDNRNDAFRLGELAGERITAAQQRVFIVILSGLAIIALVTGGASWFVRRSILGPLVRLQTGTRELAGGNLDYRLGIDGDDEIGDLSRNFDAMTRKLRDSFDEIKRRNLALASAEERFRAMFESAPTAMVMTDKAGTIMMANAQSEALFGYARNELVGQSVDLLVPQRLRGAHAAQRDGFFVRPQARRMGEGRDLNARRKDGSEFPVEIGLNPITTPGGLFVLSAIVDLTERRRALDEINNLNVALVLQTGQLEIANQELESFSYSVSHDLRAPLRAMDGFSLVLLEDHGAKLDAEGKDALERIRAASQRMGELIDDLLRLANVTRTALSVGPVDLSALACECADALQRAQPGRSVEWQIEPGLRLEADAPLIRIAMQNLIGNAWKFSGRKERATIRVGAVARNGGRAYFVADDGAGFDPAYASRMFEAFQRLHHSGEFEGTGIGLAIVKRIVRRHGGRIWAESKPGAGATFYFTLGKKEGDCREQQRHSAG